MDTDTDADLDSDVNTDKSERKKIIYRLAPLLDLSNVGIDLNVDFMTGPILE
jgi:hypothetical protein